MATSSTKEKFEAAVNVIQSLPKNGSFQPSHALMLQFYSYYKQATQGACDIARPAFWDVVGKAKWDAWSKLGDMSRDEAMRKYVEQLKAIIEAMPHTDSVSDFVEKLGDFYVLVDDDDTPVPNGDLNPDGSPRKVGQLLRQHRLAAQKGAGNQPDSDGSSAASSASGSPARDTAPPSGGAETEAPSAGEEQSQPQVALPATKLSLNNNSLQPDSADEFGVSSGGGSGDSRLPNGRATRALHPAPPNGRVNGWDDSDSEVEEYLDTSDRPQQEVEVHTVTESARHVTPDHVDHSYPAPEPSDRWVPIDRDPSEALTCRGGGDTPVEGRGGAGAGGVRRSGSSASVSSQRGGSEARRLSASGAGRSGALWRAGGGSGGEGQDPNYSPHNRGEVSEQIAVALTRLQHDMHSVLTRLSTLEALSVAAQARRRSRTPSPERRAQHSPWWWPLPQLSARSAFFVLVWPFVVHLLLRFLASRANRRRR